MACLWEQRVGRSDVEHRVLPDGCADVIVGFGGAVAVGLADTAVVHHLGAGSSCRGLRLRPDAVRTFFDVDATELRNREVPLDELLGTAEAGHLVDTVLHGAPHPRLQSAAPEQVTGALRLLADHGVDDTAEALGVSGRHLRRLLLTHTGLGPKEHQRVRRLRRFLDTDESLAVAAVQAGYADQPHLTREVVRLCGVTPAALRAARRPVARSNRP